MQVTKLSPFGARIDGVDIADLTKARAEGIAGTAAQHGVAILRGQSCDDHRFVAFLSALGPMTFTEGETRLAGRPELNVVSNIGRETPPRSVFHTDTSYVSAPPAFTALRAVTVPQAGGETVFTSTYDAYDRLDAELQERLQGAELLHEVTGVTPGDGQETQCWHPVLRRHPATGRISLFLSTPARCTALRLADGSDASALIPELYAHATSQAHELRHAWAAGDVVIWDNRCTLHRGDHTSCRGNRVLHRGMVAGERPVAA